LLYEYRAGFVVFTELDEVFVAETPTTFNDARFHDMQRRADVGAGKFVEVDTGKFDIPYRLSTVPTFVTFPFCMLTSLDPGSRYACSVFWSIPPANGKFGNVFSPIQAQISRSTVGAVEPNAVKVTHRQRN
jgi:hypothetical protein